MPILSLNSLVFNENLSYELNKKDSNIRILALKRIAITIDDCWHLVAEHLEIIESLFEEKTSNEKQIAAFIASKIYYNLREIRLSLEYALYSGNLFNIKEKNKYIQSLINQSIDEYIRIRKGKNNKTNIYPKLENIMEEVLEMSFNEGHYNQTLGISLEVNRIDFIEKTIKATNFDVKIITHVFDLCETNVTNKIFRNQIFVLLLKSHQKNLMQTGKTDFRNICKCLYFLRNSSEITNILVKLIDQNYETLCYQITLDLLKYEDFNFTCELKKLMSQSIKANEQMLVNIDYKDTIRKRIISILNGEFKEEVNLQILFMKCQADLLILKRIKDSVFGQNGSLNMAIAAANALMHCGTTIDQFLRDNLKWFGRFKNFDKFLSIAFIGIIHKGHIRKAREVLNSYLPPSGSSIANGGGLYALGIIHSNFCPIDVQGYIYEQIQESESNEIYRHGAILGSGLISMGTQNSSLFKDLLKIMEKGSAVPGSAAGYSLGLLMAGTMNNMAIQKIQAYININTQQKSEKVIRGCVMALSLICYEAREKANFLIEVMKNHTDFHLRYGACYIIALSYIATNDNTATRFLLDMAVSDVSNDVRRAATTSIGFIFLNHTENLFGILGLLVNNYNPYVRYGAASAISIAFAATGNHRAWKLLQTLMKDNVTFVIQAAYIAIGILFMEKNNKESPEIKSVRNELYKSSKNKQTNSKAEKIGAFLSLGLLDAGGKNMKICLVNSNKTKIFKGVIGMCMFWQFWNWYPLIPMISLTLKSTFLIGMTNRIEFPKFNVLCNSKPVKFKYTAPLKEHTKNTKLVLEKAELSITAKLKKKSIKRPIDKELFKDPKVLSMSKNMSVNTFKVKEKKINKKPNFWVIENPCRITDSQKEFISFLKTKEHYKIFNERSLISFVLIQNSNSTKKENFISVTGISSINVD